MKQANRTRDAPLKKFFEFFSKKDEVRDMCINLLPPYQIPSVIELVESIEKNASGKQP